MNVFKFILGVIILSLTCTSFGQDDLDDMFDDGDKTSKIKIGMDLITLGSGTPNLYIDYRPIELFGIQGGIGVSPFSTHIDLVNMQIFGSPDIPLIDRNLGTGLYTNLGLKLYVDQSLFNDLDFYYYVEWEHRRSTYNTDFHVFKNKGNCGTGYEIGLPGRFTLDGQFGLLLSFDKMTTEADYFRGINEYIDIYDRGHHIYSGKLSSKQFTAFFDFNLSISFAL